MRPSEDLPSHFYQCNLSCSKLQREYGVPLDTLFINNKTTTWLVIVLHLINYTVRGGMHINNNPLQTSLEELGRWGKWKVRWRFAYAQPTASEACEVWTHARSDNQVGLYHHPSILLVFRSSNPSAFYARSILRPPQNVFLSSDLLSSSQPLFSISDPV